MGTAPAVGICRSCDAPATQVQRLLGKVVSVKGMAAVLANKNEAFAPNNSGSGFEDLLKRSAGQFDAGSMMAGDCRGVSAEALMVGGVSRGGLGSADGEVEAPAEADMRRN